MAFNGNGGNATFLILDDDWNPLSLVTLELAAWSIQDMAAEADITTVNADGMRCATKGYGINWTVALPVEVDLWPEIDGIVTGDVMTVWLKVGELNAWHKIDHSMITVSAPVANSTGDAYRTTITGKGGRVTYYSGTPSLSG